MAGARIAKNPPRSVTDQVDRRDLYRCMRCGVAIDGGSRHHRQRRQVGGHSLPQLVLLCGSGTTGCHGWVHAHPQQSREHGYIVRTHVPDPATIPVLIGAVRQSGNYWALLTDLGGIVRITSTEAQERLEAN
ncbi:hypothetical protein EDD25_2781 [Cryobacterium psychrophilum]|nr:hypothetical protein EDD25_2781 [Cryobacterium psychrophilum]